MKITVIGSGHMADSTAEMLGRENEVNILREDNSLEEISGGFKYAELIVISIMVPYDTELNVYDIHDVDMFISHAMRFAPDAPVILRSDVPVGYTKRVKFRYPKLDIAFVPDFSRDGRALQDALNPARVVIGGGSEELQNKIKGLFEGLCEIVVTGSDEAESVKLFANAFLAMRVAFFNELDTYAELRGFDTEAIIKSVSLDPRIGDLYNNPSFGYGGKYLVEGTCRLRNEFADIPERMVDMVELSNEIRKDHVVNMIMKRKPQCCGIYGLSVKTGSRDFKSSAVDGVIRRLQARGVKVVIFEPMLKIERFLSSDVIVDFREFCNMSDVIIANRVDDKIKAFKDKLYTRDVFERD